MIGSTKLSGAYLVATLLLGAACSAATDGEEADNAVAPVAHVDREEVLTSAGYPCEQVGQNRCRVETDYGSLYFDDFDADRTSALVIDIGGPGIAPGIYEGVEIGTDIPARLAEHQIVFVGESFGVGAVSDPCLDALSTYIRDFASSGRKFVDECDLQQYVDNYSMNMARALSDLQNEFGYERIDVVGGSFAGARWQLIASMDQAPDELGSIVVVSPLQHGEKLVTIANWQGAHASRVWLEACASRYCSDWVDETQSVNEGIAALILMSRSDATVASIYSALEVEDTVNVDTKAVGLNQMLLGSAGFASQRTFEYFVGICSTVDPAPAGLDSSVFAEFVFIYHRACREIDAPVISYPETKERPCFVTVADDPVVPPVDGSANGDYLKIVEPSELADGHKFTHGSVSAGFTAVDLDWC